MPCAASPPSAFCQEKVTTSSLAQSSDCAKAAEVASQIVRPRAVGGDPVGVRHAHAGGRAVPREHHVAREVDGAKIGQFAIGRFQRRAKSASFNSLATSETHPSPKLSHASTSTPRAPSIDHNAISTAPVSEPGVMAMR